LPITGILSPLRDYSISTQEISGHCRLLTDQLQPYQLTHSQLDIDSLTDEYLPARQTCVALGYNGNDIQSADDSRFLRQTLNFVLGYVILFNSL